MKKLTLTLAALGVAATGGWHLLSRALALLA